MCSYYASFKDNSKFNQDRDYLEEYLTRSLVG